MCASVWACVWETWERTGVRGRKCSSLEDFLSIYGQRSSTHAQPQQLTPKEIHFPYVDVVYMYIFLWQYFHLVVAHYTDMRSWQRLMFKGLCLNTCHLHMYWGICQIMYLEMYHRICYIFYMLPNISIIAVFHTLESKVYILLEYIISCLKNIFRRCNTWEFFKN